jgi:hypothetical protein
MKIPEHQEGLELNETHQLLVYVGDVNMVGKNINTIKKDTVGLEVNVEKTKYIIVSYHQNVG